jgi:hypothetical protein
MARPLEIFKLPIRVLSTIQLDHQSRSKADKIHDVVSHRHLSPETIAAQLPVADEAPEAAFGIAGIRAQCACG